MVNSKLLERLVTKFSIKVNDLARYLEISKATIYNYRNLEEFSQIPNDKQYRFFFFLVRKARRNYGYCLTRMIRLLLQNILRE